MNIKYNKTTYTGSVVIQDFQMEELINILLSNNYGVQVERKTSQKVIISAFEKDSTANEPKKEKEAIIDARND